MFKGTQLSGKNNNGARLMKRRNVALILAAVLGVTGWMGHKNEAMGASGTWTNLAGGTWSTSTNWSGGTIADGAGFTADFSTLNITADQTVTLDTSRSIGTLKFQDTTASNNWLLANTAGAVLTLDNGVSVPVIDVLNQSVTITAPLAGTNGFQKIDAGNLTINAANTALSGTVFLLRGNVVPLTSTAFGTGTITINPGTSVNTLIGLTAGVNIANNVVMTSSNSGAGITGSIMTNGAFDATMSGTITINAGSTSGGHFAGSTGTNYLNLTGAVTDTLGANFVAGGTGNGLVIRQGNVRMSGGGSYFRIDERGGTLAVGATNGIATNAIVNLGGNGNGQLDLAGFNQSIVAVSQLIGSNTNTVTNSSTTNAATLTLTPNPSSYSVSSLTNLSFGGVISDASASFPLNIVVDSVANPNSGDTTGIQVLTGANTYRGSTKVSSGTLSVSSLAPGGSASAIGSSSNAAGNLVLDGGTFLYTGGTVSTDRSYTITAAKSGTINVGTAATNLTISGGSAATSGSLVKSGLGTLTLSGVNSHTGATSISAGVLLVSGSLASGSAVSIGNGAILGGTGTVGGVVTPTSGGIIAPGDPSSNFGVGTLNVGGLVLNSGSILNMEFFSGNDQITVGNAGGLTVNGASIRLYNGGGITAFSTNGTYTLFNLTGGFTGSVSNFSITNTQPGKAYSLAGSSTAITLTIGDAVTREWNGSADGLWTNSSNWIGGVVPNGFGVTAKFGSNLSGASVVTVSPNGAKTVGGMIFDNSSVSYTITSTGTITLDNGVGAAAINVVNGSHTINAALILNGSGAFDTGSNSANSLTVNGNITGAKPVSITGSGTVTLGGTNGYTATSLSTGTLNIGVFGGGSTGSLGSGTLTMSGNATLNLNLNTNSNFAGGITGAGSINQLGSGTFSVAGAITGVTTVNVANGLLVASSGLNQSGGVSVFGNGSLTVTSGGLTGGSGSIGLSVSTSGTVTLGGASTYSGGTTISSGTLALLASSSLPTNTVLELDGGRLDLHGNNLSLSNVADQSSGGIIANDAASGTTSTINFAGFQANTAILSSINDGNSGGKVAFVSNIGNTVLGATYTLQFHGSSTYSGGTTIGSQSIEADATNAFGLGPINILKNPSSVNTSQIKLTGGISIPNNIIVAQDNAGGNNAVISYVTGATGSTTITGSVTLLTDGNGNLFSGPLVASGDTLNINGQVLTTGPLVFVAVPAGNVRFSGGGSYSSMLINSTGVSLGANNGLATNAVVTLGTSGAGTLDLNGFNQTLAGIAQTGSAGVITNTSGTTSTLTVASTADSSYAGSINGNLNFVKAGSATLTLSTAQAYTGGTTIGGGKLVVTNTTGSATGTGNVTVTSGGTLGGSGIVSGAVAVGSGGILSPGVSTVSSGVGTITVGGLTLNSGSVLNYEFAGAALANDLTAVTTSGGLTINGGGVNIYQPGTTTLYGVNGVYNLISYTGAIGGTGASALSVLNGSGSKIYQFGLAGGFVTLRVADPGTLPNYWNVNANGNWTTDSNWTSSPHPNLVNAVASFGGGGTAITAPRTVTLDANQTVGEVDFNSAFSFSIVGSNTLTLNAGGGNATISDTNGSHLMSVPLTLSSSTIFNVTNAADTLTLSGAIAGTVAGVSKTGAGKLVLAGANTYVAGNVIAGGGTVAIVGSGTLGAAGNGLTLTSGVLDLGGTTQTAGTVALTQGTIQNGTLNQTSVVMSGTGTATISATLAGGGSITGATSPGLLSITGPITASAVTVLGGRVQFGGGTTPASTFSSITINSTGVSLGADNGLTPTATATLASGSNGTLDLNGFNQTLSGILSGVNTAIITNSSTTASTFTLNTATTDSYGGSFSGNLNVVKAGAGTLALTGTSGVTIGGVLNITGGAFQFGAQNIQTAGLIGSGVLQSGSTGTATQTFIISNPLVSNTFSGTLSDGGTAPVAVSVVGSGTQVFSNTNSYSGGTSIGSAGDMTVVRATASGALGTGPITIVPNAGSNANGRLEISGGITLANTINYHGRVTTSASPVGLESISGNNTLSGTVFLIVGGNQFYLQSDAGTLNLTNPTSIDGSGVGGARFLQLQGAGDGVISGAIAAGNLTLSVNKSGTGTWTLAGSNVYTGGTTINGGTLAAAGFTLPTPTTGANVTVNAGGVYKLIDTTNALHTSPISITDSSFGSYLSFAGGKMSLGNNDVIITGSANEGTVNSLITAPTQAALGASGAPVYVTSSVLTGQEYTALTGRSKFDGASFAAGDLLLRYGLAGDVTGSGRINIDDYLAIDSGFKGSKPAYYVNGDFNHDGVIDVSDYALIDYNALHQGSSLADGEISLHTAEFGSVYTSAFSALGVSAVPEPASLALLAVGVSSLMIKRRRR